MRQMLSLAGGLDEGKGGIVAGGVAGVGSHVRARVQQPVVFGAAGRIVDAVESQAGVDALGLRDGRTLLGEVVREAVDAALGEVLAAGLAAVVVAVAVVVQLGASLEELEDQGIGPATHLATGPGTCASAKHEATERWEIIKRAES